MDWIVKFGGGSETNLTGLAIILLAIGFLVALVVPRKFIFAPVFITGLILPQAQEIVFLGMHFQAIRILIVTGWLRILFGRKSDAGKFRLNKIDKTFICYLISNALIFFLLWMKADALVNRLGIIYVSLGVYFMIRLLAREEADLHRLIAVFAVITIIFGAFMLIEQRTGRNFFSSFGGVPEYTVVREGKLRAQASFESPISAGTFGACLLPLFVGIWRQKGAVKLFGLMGIVGSTAMTITAHSATCIAAYAAGVVGLLMWPLRNRMKWIRRGIVAIVVGLELVMKGPVWSLIERVDIVGGQSGFHRYQLVDGFIRHFFDWALVGVRSTVGWGYYTFDQANMFVYVGENGGLITFVLFLAIIAYCFKGLGNAGRALECDVRCQKFMWALGAALFAHLVAFIGLSYFDQTLTELNFLFAIIAAATAAFWLPASESSSSAAPTMHSAMPSPPWAGRRAANIGPITETGQILEKQKVR